MILGHLTHFNIEVDSKIQAILEDGMVLRKGDLSTTERIKLLRKPTRLRKNVKTK